MTLTEFLLARIAEEEAVSRAAVEGPWDTMTQETADGENIYFTVDTASGDPILDLHESGALGRSTSEHIARWDPARVLAECEAKRRIVEAHLSSEAWCDHCSGGELMGNPDGCPTLRLLALPYADHADYDESWRP